MHLITYPDVVYKVVATDAILIQTRCVQSVVSLENTIPWFIVHGSSLWRTLVYQLNLKLYMPLSLGVSKIAAKKIYSIVHKIETNVLHLPYYL